MGNSIKYIEIVNRHKFIADHLYRGIFLNFSLYKIKSDFVISVVK